MSQLYKYSRNSWENQEKAIFDGVGMYDIPVIEPEEYHHVEWIGFNSARTTQKRKGLNKETRAAEYIDRYRYNWDE